MRMRSGALMVQVTITVPFSLLYLIALESRLMTICFKRVASALTKMGLASLGKVIWMPRCCACGSIMDWHSDKTSASDTDSIDNDTCPDSITARSRISLISFSRCHPAWRIWAMRADWEAVGNGTADSISCAKPRIALSGLRSSWLMLERKSDLARLALSLSLIHI